MITILITALNEEKNIEATFANVMNAAKATNLHDIEVIICNDGSTDRTGEIADSLAAIHDFVKVVHNNPNLGVGRTIKKVIPMISKERFLIVAGDNDLAPELLVELFRNARKADMVMAYYLNKEMRGRRRNIVSQIYASIHMITFDIFVQYITGPCVYNSEMLKSLELKSNRFSIIAEMNIKMLRSGATFCEISGYMQTGVVGSSSLSLKNLTEVVASFLRMVVDINIVNRKLYSLRPKRVF